MRLPRYEQETIICYNEEEETASVYTHDNRLIVKLKRLAGKHPDKIRLARKNTAQPPDSPFPNGAYPYGSHTATPAAPPTAKGRNKPACARLTGAAKRSFIAQKQEHMLQN